MVKRLRRKASAFLIVSLLFILAIAIAISVLWYNVLFAASYDTLIKIVPIKIQDWSTKSASLVRISSNTIHNMTNMMNQAPQNVIIKVKSSQIIPVGKESQIALLVLDKNTGKPMTGAQVVIGIERGASMSTMDMMGGSMFDAKEQKGTSGLYLLGFTPDSKGYYTMHTHVIPHGKSMDSMMDNHLDIGLIAK
ncbi:MAG: hypothetical protein ACJ72Q_18670 [Nitrososphaeraceae archaeon]